MLKLLFITLKSVLAANALLSIVVETSANAFGALKSLGALDKTAIFFFDPFNKAFSRNLVAKIREEGHDIGLFIPEHLLLTNKIEENLVDSVERFRQISGFRPFYVHYEASSVSNVLKGIAGRNGLFLIRPTLYTLDIDDPSGEHLSHDLDQLDSNRGDLILTVMNPIPDKVELICNCLEARKYEVINAEGYYISKLRRGKELAMNGKALKSVDFRLPKVPEDEESVLIVAQDKVIVGKDKDVAIESRSMKIGSKDVSSESKDVAFEPKPKKKCQARKCERKTSVCILGSPIYNLMMAACLISVSI